MCAAMAGQINMMHLHRVNILTDKGVASRSFWLARLFMLRKDA